MTCSKCDEVKNVRNIEGENFCRDCRAPSFLEVAVMLKAAGHSFSFCGLNADWVDAAWHLGPSKRANATDGDYYLLQDENKFSIVQRFYVDGGNDDIRPIIECASLELASSFRVQR